MLIAGGSWLCGGFHLDGPHGVTVDSQNAVNATFAYADLGFRVVRCEAGTHPRDGLEPMEDWPVVLKLDPRDYDPLEGAAFRGNLLRTGVHPTEGVTKLSGVKWKFPTGGPVRSSPVVVGGVVYVGSDGGHFHAIEAATGEERWRVAVEGGVLSSACVANGVVYFGGNGGKLYAVDAGTGEVKWTAGRKGRITTSPAVAHGLVFVEGAQGYDAKTGRLAWSTGRGAYRPGDDRLSSAIVWRDKLIQNGSVCDLATAQFVLGTGDPWAGQNCDALADDTLFTLNSGVGGAVNLPRLEARELAMGRTLWSREIVAPGQPVTLRKVVLTSPTVWQGRVYLGFDGGLLFCFDARDGKTLWAFEAGGAIRSSAAVSARDATVYFGCHDGHLYALDAMTGAERWRFRTGGKVTSSPCPAAGCVYVGSDDGCVYALAGRAASR
jgi:outer membrane protein assembly factor BamB